MEPHLSISPMAPAGANEVSPRSDLPRPQRAFRIRAVVELDPRPPRHTMADVLKEEEEDDQDMRDPTPGPDELEEEIAESDLKLDHDGVVHPDHDDARQKRPPQQQQQHTMSGARWAARPATFTAAQDEELEQQALIYKYLVAGVPVPPDLRLPIRRGFDSLASCFYHHHARAKIEPLNVIFGHEGGGDQVNNICLEDLWPSSTPSPCTSARSSVMDAACLVSFFLDNILVWQHLVIYSCLFMVLCKL
ncbi:hypothetical protein VPH35_102951 [Triticum aestivum]|uniref:Growth-regulating factor n=2 Tax=Triticum TaxID=4564 RepID=A0A9R0XT54_TRITD|nr:unnamed protein product [Triticum turgidum subsp. durum]